MRPYVISLSTIPPRFHLLAATLKTLVRQTVKPQDIIVNIPLSYRRFPDWDGTLPDVPDGVTIHRCADDFGPATKLLPTLTMFRDQDIDILFCDDDMDYRPEWAGWFLKQRARRPEACISLCGGYIDGIRPKDRKAMPKPRPLYFMAVINPELRLRRAVHAFGRRFLGWPDKFIGRRLFLTAGYADLFQGFGGVMIRPHFFDEGVFDIPKQLWAVDDWWLSGNAIKNGHPVWVIPRRPEPDSHPHSATEALTDAVFDGRDRGESNAFAESYLRERFGIWT